MGQKPTDDRKQPSLELPSLSLGLGRRSRRRRATDTEVAAAEPQATTAAATPPAEVERSRSQVQVPAATARPEHPPTAHEEPPAPTRRSTAAADVRPDEAPRAPRRRAERPAGRSVAGVPGPVAAVLTGLVVGTAGALATFAAMTGCEVLRGTSSCGGAAGFALLVAIVALMVLLGGALLKAFSVAAATSTSFLAVGIVVVVLMLFLLDAVFSGWMFVIVPALGAAAFLLSHWVTTRFDEEQMRAG